MSVIDSPKSKIISTLELYNYSQLQMHPPKGLVYIGFQKNQTLSTLLYDLNSTVQSF